jgi:hypothetical protein
MLPCCCGVGCSETKAFFSASGISKSKAEGALDKQCDLQFPAYDETWSFGVSRLPGAREVLLAFAAAFAVFCFV